MNINPDFQSDSELNAETAMEICMSAIFEIALEPAIKKGEVSEIDQELLDAVGMTLKGIAQKAKAYEELQGRANEGNHFRN
tara:strand:+ start:1221 stop:1463 length:243 start_codon:yes stop_codon:yes gene_type:complete